MENVNIQTGTRNDIFSLFDYEKTSKTIDEELNKHNSFSFGNKEEEFKTEEIGEKKVFRLGNAKVESLNSEEEEEQGERKVLDVEEFYESAKFCILVTDWFILFGTNLYLKNQGLEKLTKKDFEKSATSEKALVKAWAELLHKYQAKISVEIRLLMTLSAVYGTKISVEVDKKKIEKLEKENAILKERIKSINNGKKEFVKSSEVVNFSDIPSGKKDSVVFDVDNIKQEDEIILDVKNIKQVESDSKPIKVEKSGLSLVKK